MRMQTLSFSTLLAAGFCILPVTAEITPTAPDPLEVSQEAETIAETEAGSRLRCWQYGQLLFEANGISDQAAGKNSKAASFAREDGENNKLHLMNIGTSTCLFEQK